MALKVKKLLIVNIVLFYNSGVNIYNGILYLENNVLEDSESDAIHDAVLGIVLFLF